MSPNVTNTVIRVLLRQLVTCLLLGLLIGCVYDTESSGSFLLGVVTVVLPNFVLMFLFFRRWRERSKASLLISLYIGELIKLIFCGVLVYFSVKLIPVNIVMMLLGVVSAYVAFWLFAAGSVYKKSKQGA